MSVRVKVVFVIISVAVVVMAAKMGVFFTGALLLVLSALSAVVFEGLAKPYRRIEEQNAHLAALNEVAKNASEAKNRFLANMSHEMRTPLNAVVGLSELMLGTNGTQGEVGDNLGKIHNAGMTLLAIVNDILDISKIESGKFELMPAEYDVSSLINDTVTLNIMRIGDKPVKFNLRIDETLPAKLFGDELRIKQICNNLLSNAFKYTKEGSVDWFVACEKEKEGDKEGDVWLSIRVTDTGIGIRPEDIKNLFSAYNQVDTKSNRKIEGTGLGLSIAKMMVEMMGGTITVTSEYGKGSEFAVRIRQGFVTDVPIGKDVAESLKRFRYCDSKRNANAKLVRIRLPYAKVLVVDDVQTNLDVAKGMMKPYGMRVDCVTSGQQAIDRIRKEKVIYDAIFMDHMMPEMDGIETTRVIRREIGTEYAKNIPIIALTANAIIGNEKMFLENGFQAFISKPIDIAQLDAVIRQWLRNKTLEKTANAQIQAQTQTQTQENGARLAPSGSTPLEALAAPCGETAEKLALGGIDEIEEIDVGKCLPRFGGDGETFLRVLRSYAVNTEPLLDQVREVSKDKLPEYAIVVHGIKGSSRGIGAESLGNMAEALERAAKAGDMEFVLMNNSAFIQASEKLLDDLRAALRAVDAENPKPRKGAPSPVLLEKLAERCEDYDMDGVDEVMAEIESFEYETRADLIVWLRERIDRMEFAEIRERLSATAA
ncbi:MAG: response regulator [Synergistaceae bacterium]|jgi:signal transduction histidine kinase/DNA-binding response OmpR family regulator/HPt (histidine-containing phosphotransfer) domain-containing protein|nr:response regulator [Synergistaceae bacterium]